MDTDDRGLWTDSSDGTGAEGALQDAIPFSVAALVSVSPGELSLALSSLPPILTHNIAYKLPYLSTPILIFYPAAFDALVSDPSLHFATCYMRCQNYVSLPV